MSNIYSHLTPAQIAATVTLRQAAEATTPRPQDINQRVGDAFHEGHHVVVDARHGYRTGYVVIPNRDHQGHLIRPHGWPPEWPVLDHATTRSIPNQRDDLITQLEDAVSYHIGIVAECVWQGWRIPELPDAAKSDHAKAYQCLETYVRTRHKLHGGRADLTNRKLDNLIGVQHRLALRRAQVLAGRHFSLIDSVATIILCHGCHGGLLSWTDRHHEWLMNEIHHKGRGRPHARETYLEQPPWLRTAARGKPTDFEAMRKRLGPGLTGGHIL